MGIMEATAILYKATCEVCAKIRNGLYSFWMGCIAVGESAGRARAARELYRMGYLAEAKKLMTNAENK